MTDQNDTGSPRGRLSRGRLVALIGAGVVVLALIITGLSFAAVRGNADYAVSHPTITHPTPVPSAPPVAGPTPTAPQATSKPTIDPHYGAVVAQTIPQGTTASFGSGVTAVVTKIVSKDITGKGPGEVSGPALIVTLDIHNGTSSVLSLDSVFVNGYYGPDKTPAAPLDSATSAVKDNLAPGADAQGTYAFSVPKSGQSSFVATLGSGGSPVIVVTN
jgi:hypothetical protein